MTKPTDNTFEVTIQKLVYGGHGLGRHEGKVVFVPFSVPGDRLRVQAVEEKPKYVRAEILELLEPGPGRAEPRCVHFGRCGGCQWQHLEYGRQVEAKRGILEELLHHKLPVTRNLTITMNPSPQPYGYRSRARLQVRDLTVGFNRFLSHDVEDIEMCPLFGPTLNQALASVRSARHERGANSGVFQVAISSSEEEAKWAAGAVEPDLDEDASSLWESGKDASSTPALLRRVGEYSYTVAPGAFFQANDSMVSELTDMVQTLALDTERSSLLDLYSGVGLFSLPLARHFRNVVAVENSAVAAHLCVLNVAAAGFSNLETHCADVATWMRKAGSFPPPSFDVIVLNPPRAGAGAEVMKRIEALAPRIIVYVSCDPQTLCRDIAVLRPDTYDIDWVRGLDLFPQSYHFETVVRLKRR